MSQELLWKAVELPIGFLQLIRNVNTKKPPKKHVTLCTAANEGWENGWGGGGGGLSHNDLSVWRRGDGLYKVRKCPLHTTRQESPLIRHFFLWEHMHIHTTPQKWEHVHMCICVYVRVYPHPHPLIHAGGDVKEMGGIWWSVFICSISLFFLRGRGAMLKTLHEGWGYILLLPLHLIPLSLSLSIPHLFPAPHKDSIEGKKCLVDV